MLKKIVSLALCAGVLILSSGCSKYNTHNLFVPSGAAQESNDLVLITKKLSRDECKAYFSSKSLSKKYDPIQIYIENRGNQTVKLSANNIDLPIEKSRVIYKKISSNTALKIFGYCTLTVGLLSLSALSLLTGALCSPLFGGPITLTTKVLFGVSAVSCGAAMGTAVAGPVDGVKSRSANQKLKDDIHYKILGHGESIVIKPHQAINKVIFVKKRYSKNQFLLKLLNSNNEPAAEFNCHI